MDRDQLRSILSDVADRTRTIDEALSALRDMPFEDATVAVIDHHRSLRTGVPEVIYGASKTPAQIAAIVDRMVTRNRNQPGTDLSTVGAIRLRPAPDMHKNIRCYLFRYRAITNDCKCHAEHKPIVSVIQLV